MKPDGKDIQGSRRFNLANDGRLRRGEPDSSLFDDSSELEESPCVRHGKRKDRDIAARVTKKSSLHKKNIHVNKPANLADRVMNEHVMLCDQSVDGLLTGADLKNFLRQYNVKAKLPAVFKVLMHLARLEQDLTTALEENEELCDQNKCLEAALDTVATEARGRAEEE